ncbi:FG-GAP-like repeat-containing protein [Bacteroides nordii]|jgi:putative FG-GAP repeat protein|uniref:RHS repeat-associated core domain-containing protein n=1 Tax=Bacteroides nordii TaxID=291645 RepID=UPI00210B4687|nr:RHS repeat-associated core domain-containing protein [Bacteroides nordii]MCQ4914913.1 FG-GAP-like repeat-containing protein [Bacteroides nordii]
MKKIYFVFILMICFITNSKAQNTQPNWELQTPQSGNNSYVARDYILLKPGFSYTATPGESFHAYTNPCLLFPPTDNTYARPDGTIVGDASQGAVVGKIPGELNVGASGNAAYTIPISCPPGVNGVQPNISLVYNSQSGNGIAGWGWNLGGLSMISRVPKNYYYDNEKSGIIWDKYSPLALDGQRLVVNGPLVSSSDTIEYRTENDESNKIVGYNITAWGPKYFKIFQKDGNVLEYGNRSSLASYFPVKSSSLNLPDTEFYNLGWALHKITDPNHNFVEYVYATNNSLSGSYSFSDTRLSSIIYGHEENGSKQIVATIYFEYDVIANMGPMYIDGMETRNRNCLKKIVVKGLDSQTLETYDLKYEPERDIYHLVSIKKTNASGESFLPIEFTWGAHSYSQEYSSEMTLEQTPRLKALNSEGYEISSTIKFWGDINGDGISDPVVKFQMKNAAGNMKYLWVMYRNGGNGWFYYVMEADEFDWNTHRTFVFADNDNDGKDELYIGEAATSPYYSLYCFKYQNGVFGAYSSGDVNIRLSEYDFGRKDELYAIPGDFLGDGSTQFMVIVGNNYICKFSVDGVSSDIGYCKKIYLTDINGNGKQELMCMTDNTTNFYEYSKLSNSFVNIYSTDKFHHKDKIHIGDFNGDGNTDILRQEYVRSDYRYWSIWNSTGKSLFDTGLDKKVIPADNTVKIMLLDINQDGKTDILVKYPNYDHSGYFPQIKDYSMKLLLNVGNTFVNVMGLNNKNSQDFDFSVYGKFDSGLNKNVFVENTYLVNSTIKPHYYTFCRGVKFNKILKIKNAYEDEYVINYKSVKSPFNGGTNITVDANILTSLPPEFEVVSQITGKLFNQQYTFGTPLIHKQGKGFFGFKNIQIRDNINGRITVNENDMNTEYYVTYPKSTLTKTTTGSLISESKNVYSFVKQQKAFHLQLQSQTQKDYLSNVTVTKEYSRYDDSNNPQSIVTKYGTSFTETQELKYIKKGSWCANKIEKITTTKSRAGVPDDIRTQEYTYDGKGNLLTKTEDPNTSFAVSTVYSNYDKYGNPGLITLKAGNESRSTSLAYSSTGRFIARKTNNLLNETVTYNYDEGRSLLLSETSRLGTTIYEYDGFGRQIKTVSPDKVESVKLLKWASTGSMAGSRFYEYTETSGQSPVTVWYDNMERELGQKYYGLGGKEIISSKEYNSKGQLYRISEPYFSGESVTWASTNYYDSYGRLQSSVTPLGTTSYSYSGLTTQVTSPNTTTTTVKNALGETVSQTTNGKTVSYSYYASGAVKTATPEGGTPISMEYDLVGNRTKLTDPDAGVITTVYDAWRQLKSETQSIHIGKSPVVTNYTYSKGLLSKVNRQGEVTNYDYDSNNRLSEIRIDGKHTQQFTYDHLDRIVKLVENIKNEKSYTAETSYDVFGRIKKETYPDGYVINNSYDSYGNLISVTDSYDNRIWQGLSANARGQLTKTKQGNVEKTQSYDSRGLPSSISAAAIMNMAYTFNNKGNLISRSDLLTGHKEDFTYDTMNRLTAWNISKDNISQASNSIDYNPTTGTITTKSDVGFTFGYGEENGKPHALTSLSGKPDRIPNSAQTVTYTDFKKVKNISLGSKSLVLDYGVDEQRRKGVFKDGSATFTRYYSGNYEEEVDSSGKVKKIHYVSGGDGLVGIYINDDGNNRFYSTYCDYQGSLLVLTDMNGVVKERYAYDPWGNRRNPASWKDTETRTKFIVDRGYTLHEHLDGFGLINMNGRVYDPLLGMFLSPDPYVQAPGNWLNYNRYGYCYGNPLSYTDPDGEFFFAAIFIGAIMNAAIQGFTGNLHGGVGDFFKAAGIGALSGAAGAGAGSILGTAGFVSGAINGTLGGFAGGMVSGAGNAWMDGASFGQGLKTGLIGGTIGGANGLLVGGLVSGITAVRHGGNFWSGKGTTFINEMVASANDDLGGKYFQDDITMKSYIESKNGWTEGKYGVDDISVEKSPGEYRRYFYDRENGVLNKMQLEGAGPMVRVNGVTVNHQPNFFASNNTIYLSSRSSLAAFTETLNHELIHAYHHSLGLPSMLGRNFHTATENSAYTYTLLHTTSSAGYSSALRQLNKYPRPYMLSWPKFLISIP